MGGKLQLVLGEAWSSRRGAGETWEHHTAEPPREGTGPTFPLAAVEQTRPGTRAHSVAGSACVVARGRRLLEDAHPGGAQTVLLLSCNVRCLLTVGISRVKAEDLTCEGKVKTYRPYEESLTPSGSRGWVEHGVWHSRLCRQGGVRAAWTEGRRGGG